jgi:serine/threonine protein kinase
MIEGKLFMTATFKNILETGTVLNDKWVILELIGKGGMGEVYRAHQLNLKRDVAIKVISKEWLQTLEDDVEEIEKGLQRFRREVQAMSQIRHPNVLQIFDYGSDSIKKDGEDSFIEYIVMEYIPGATLRFTMSEEGFHPDQETIKDWLEDYFLPVLDGVQAIHELGMVHRDLKPENVLMDGTTPKIADFGLARSTRMAPITQSVDIKGTMPYMSPEHFLDFKKADQGADIYSLGKILFEAIAGKIPPESIPFKSTSLAKADTPFLEKLDKIIQDATAEERVNRIESVAELRKTVLEALDIIGVQTATEAAETPRSHSFLYQAKWIWTGVAVALIAVMAMTVWHFLGEPGKQQMPSEEVQLTREEPVHAGRSGSRSVELTSPAAPDQTIMGNDGLTMLFVPGGDMRSDQGNTLKLQSYYIDKTKVSNHHFAEFLNEVKGSISVENGVVKKAGEIWFYLGEGTEPYEQIIYRHNRFHLRDPKYAALPVVRVTWYGASAYARHYGRRLLTEHEWQYAARLGIIQSRVSLDGTASTRSDVVREQVSKPSEHMMDSHHRIKEDSSSASEKSLEGKAPKEWVVRAESYQGITNDKQQASYPSLIIGGSSVSGSEMKSVRYPWEGFFDVGFRCALSIDN